MAKHACHRRLLAFTKPLTTSMLLILVVGLTLSAADAWGCPTCKDGVAATDDAANNIARGYFYSILLMLAMPFTLASCFGVYVWREFRRQQRAGGGATLHPLVQAQLEAARQRQAAQASATVSPAMAVASDAS